MSVTFSDTSYRYLIEEGQIKERIPEWTKTHDGMYKDTKLFDNIVIMWINNQFYHFLSLLERLNSTEINDMKELIVDLVNRIKLNGRSPIIYGGGGSNCILNKNGIQSLYNLYIALDSIINVRKNILFTYNN